MPPKLKILVSIDFDAVSGWLGTGASPETNLSDYSSGFFAARVGVPRLIKLFKHLNIADKVTWFIPGHSVESFPDETRQIVESGAEIGLHGYCHEDCSKLTEEQERDVLEKCIEIVTEVSGSYPRGYRAPLYTLRHHTIKLLEEKGILYDSSLALHDSKMSFLPKNGGRPLTVPTYTPETKASSWMHPIHQSDDPDPSGTVIEIPGNWYMEDMTPMQFWPHTSNSHGYVPAAAVEAMWIERLEFLLREMEEESHEESRDDMTVFPIILHPDTSGMAHIIPMIERFVRTVQGKGDKVEFMKYGDCALQWKQT
jgi:peptidoglycan/xylan/chitin deacetylase (PgdA/CDA1 family)